MRNENTSRIKIMDVGFDSLSMDEAVALAWDSMESRSGAYVVTPNPEIVMCCHEDAGAREAVNGAALVIPDGIGIIYAAKILKTPLKAKLPGIELCSALMDRMAGQGKSVFLFGAKPGVAEKAAEKLTEAHPGLRIAGTNDGYFKDDAPIIEKINAAEPDLLLVCLGAPKQEKWMRDHAGEVKAGLMIGAGGSMDVFAGQVKRAPKIWCDLGLEWLYRLIREPWRLGRMMVLPKFMLKIIFGRQK